MLIGLTGAIGSGKSAVLKAFASLGADVFDADKLCHRYYDMPDSALPGLLCQRWGEGIFSADGRLDRRKIGEIVFADSSELDFLTSQLYPLLEKEITELVSCYAGQPDKLAVIEIPLLFECGWEDKMDCTVTVWTDRDIRHERLRKRGLSDSEIAGREARQMSAFEKIERAGFGIINNGTEDLLVEQCRILLEYMKGYNK